MRHCAQVFWLAACIVAAPLVAAGDDADEGDAAPDTGGPRMQAAVYALGYYTDNFYNKPTDATAGSGMQLGTEFSVVKQSPRVLVGLALNADYGLFDTPGSNDDYLDGAARLGLASQLTLRNQFRLDGGFKHGHDAFGVDRTEDATVRDDDLDLWNQATAALHYRYGAPGARINTEIGIGGLQKRYVTNRSATTPLNYDSTTVDYALFYNYSSKTAAVLDFSRTDFQFESPFTANTNPRDGELYRVRGGVRWQATGKTSGDARVGYRRRVFDSGAADIEGADWEAGVDWSPVPRSTLRLATARSEQESYSDLARAIDVQSIGLSWKHNLSSRTRSTLGLEQLTADFEGSGARQDDIYSGSLKVEHRALRRLWIVGEAGLVNRDSTLAGREYDRLNAFLGVRLGR